MKVLLHFTAACSCFSVSAIAQPVLTRDNCAPVSGTTYTTEAVIDSSIYPGAVGANVTWNFSPTLYDFDITYTFEDISSSQYANQYPNANLVRYSSGSPEQYFFAVTTGSYDQWGEKTAYNSHYSNAMTTLTFPFTFGDQFVDTFQDHGQDDQGSNYTLTGTDTLLADAYGTLTLQDGVVLTDVLRVKTTMHAQQVYTNSTLLIEAVTYAWYKPGIPDAVFQYTEARFNNGPWSSSVEVRSTSGLLGLSEKSLISSSVAPNPVTGMANITVGSSGKKTISFYDINGKQVNKTVEFTENELPVSRRDFGPGVYLYTVCDEAGRMAQGRIVFI